MNELTCEGRVAFVMKVCQMLCVYNQINALSDAFTKQCMTDIKKRAEMVCYCICFICFEFNKRGIAGISK